MDKAARVNTDLLVAFVGVGGTGFGAAVTYVSSAILQRAKSKREDTAARDASHVELLTAAVGFAQVIQLIWAGWVDGPRVFERVSKSSRSTVLEIVPLLMPRLDRLLHASAVVTLRRGRKDRPVVAAAQDLTDAAGGLLETMAGKADELQAKREAFGKALGKLRRSIDARP